MPSLRQAKRSAEPNQQHTPVASVLYVYKDVDYERKYTGREVTIDRSIGLFSGVSESRSEAETTFHPPKIILKATPLHRIERIVKLSPIQESDEVTLAEYTDIVHEAKAIVVADTKQDPLMKREDIDRTYTYAYGLGRVTTTGYKYVQDTDRLIHRVQAAAEELGVADQLKDWVDKAVGLRTSEQVRANTKPLRKLAPKTNSEANNE